MKPILGLTAWWFSSLGCGGQVGCFSGLALRRLVLPGVPRFGLTAGGALVVFHPSDGGGSFFSGGGARLKLVGAAAS